ncbi:MAG: hypothetical protein WHF31_16315 [Candidatus Dehalobacter alkaniphilus]
MRTLERNKQVIYYALYEDKTPIKDEYGNETGEYEIQYSTPSALQVNVSAARGENSTRAFGETENYDKVLVTDDLSVPITETSILWIDTIPIIEDGETATPHDYIVKKVAKSLNSVSFAVSKVNVSG